MVVVVVVAVGLLPQLLRASWAQLPLVPLRAAAVGTTLLLLHLSRVHLVQGVAGAGRAGGHLWGRAAPPDCLLLLLVLLQWGKVPQLLRAPAPLLGPCGHMQDIAG